MSERRPASMCYTSGAVELIARFRFDPPALDDEDVQRIARELYGVSGSRRRLRGERSHNTLFTCADGRRLVLKVQSPTEDPATIEMHASALLHLAVRAPALPVARLIPTLDGRPVPLVDIDGRRHPTRLVTYLAGETFPDGAAVSDRGLRSIGELVGEVAAALAHFDHPAADGFLAWDIANGLVLDLGLHDLLDERTRRAVDAVRHRLERAAVAMTHLPRQIIHNDGHAGNLLRSGRDDDRAIGLIDFGDMVRTVRVADLAVSGANFAPSQADPAGALALLTAGYRARHELGTDELDALPDLVLTRLVLSALLTSLQIRHTPHIAGAVAAELPGIVAGLERWSELDPVVVAERISEGR